MTSHPLRFAAAIGRLVLRMAHLLAFDAETPSSHRRRATTSAALRLCVGARSTRHHHVPLRNAIKPCATVAMASVVMAFVVMAPAVMAQDGWVSLFDGKTLNGWTTIGGVRWSVVDGAMSAEPASQPITPAGDAKQTWPQGFLRSVDTFSNFELTAEFWSEEDTNSGLFIRCAAPTNPGSLGSCYEINISDPHATTPTGGIVGVHSPLPYRVKSAGKWSRFDVLADGPHLVVKVNGETLTDARDEKLREGALGLQAGGPTGSGPVKFRNIRIRRLK